MSALLVNSFTPALGTGRGMRTYGLVRALALLGPVDVLYVPFGAPAPGAEFGGLDDVRLHAVRSSRGPRRLAAYARAVAGGTPRPVARGVSPELAAAARRLAEGRDRVIADGPSAAVSLRGLDRPVVYCAQNLESAFRTNWGPPARVAAFERSLIERSAETWMPTARDLAGARELAPSAILRLVPNVVDVAAIRPATRTDGTTAVMVADFTYAPNREGLDFLVRDVLPRAWRSAPELRLDVVGRGLDASPPGDDRVRHLGFVPSLAELYGRAACAVVPLLSGGGSPLKFVEALAYGVPVVATPRAAAGLEAVPGEHYLEGADGPAFAAALVDAVQGRAATAAAGRALAEREYSIEALAERLA